MIGWSDAGSLGWIAIAAALGVGFVLVEARRATPLLPKAQLRILDKQVAWGAVFILGAAMLSTMFFATQFMQHDLGLEPLQAGLGFIPFSVADRSGLTGAGASSFHALPSRSARAASDAPRPSAPRASRASHGPDFSVVAASSPGWLPRR